MEEGNVMCFPSVPTSDGGSILRGSHSVAGFSEIIAAFLAFPKDDMGIGLCCLLLPGREGFAGRRTTRLGSKSNADVNSLSGLRSEPHSSTHFGYGILIALQPLAASNSPIATPGLFATTLLSVTCRSVLISFV